jgi:SWI/SNF-related matrix-associated actin-dependent regulator 1 of chromatin subfamily A
MENAHVAITPEAGEFHVKPLVYLGEHFVAYRDACNRSGARYDGARKVTIVRENRVQILADALRADGFNVSAPEIKIEAQVARPTNNAAERIAKLRARGVNVRPYQEQGILWLAERESAMLTDDMGLGKTLQGLVALPDNCRCVWVCPASLRLNVVREAGFWRPDLKVTVLSGEGSFRWPADGEIVVLNYDILPGETQVTMFGKTKRVTFVKGSIPAITGGSAPLYLIADEAHALKSSRAIRTVLFRNMAKMVRAVDGVTWGMTGTELLNRALELWSLFETFGIAKAAFGSFNNFLELMGGAQGRWGIEFDKDKRSPEVVNRLRLVSLKRLKPDVMKELPAKTYSTISVEIDEKTRLFCDRVIEHAKVSGIDLNDVKNTVMLTRWKGASFELISKAMTALALAKMSAMLDIVEQYEESGEPLIVFSAHRAPIDSLKGREGWAVITGDTSAKDRNKAVEQFQAGELKGIAGTIGAMGVGLTLTRASNVLRVDRDWTPALNRQAEDRAHRIGQQNAVQVIDLVATHALDERLTALLVEKSDLIASTTEAAAVRPGETLAPQAPVKPQDAPAAPQAVAWRTINDRKVPMPTPRASRRPAANAVERWASNGLITLAGLDPDRAAEENGIGFNRLDCDFGHKLAERVAQFGGLTDREWEAAIRMVSKYRRQIGPRPEVE